MRLNKQIHKRIIFYDGVCILCNRSVSLIIRLDKKELFYFASLQSNFAERHLDELNKMDSIILLEDQQAFTKSTAALKIARSLPSVKFLYVLRYIPKGVRDYIYDFIAKYRYKVFGKMDSCPVADKNIKHRFLN